MVQGGVFEREGGGATTVQGEFMRERGGDHSGTRGSL